MLAPTVGRSAGRPVCLGVKPRIEPKTNILLLSGSCGFVDGGASSLTRGRVCRLQLLVLASTVILGSESCGTHDHILLSQIRDSPNLEGQVPIYIYPQALGSIFIASYDSQGYG
jgi:hypothetical protein